MIFALVKTDFIMNSDLISPEPLWIKHSF